MKGLTGLAEVLNAVDGMAIVSGYPSPLYEDLYRGWVVRSIDTQTASTAKATEYLYLSPKAAAAAKQMEFPR